MNAEKNLAPKEISIVTRKWSMKHFKKIEAKTQTQVSEMAMETMQMCLLTEMTHWTMQLLLLTKLEFLSMMQLLLSHNAQLEYYVGYKHWW